MEIIISYQSTGALLMMPTATGWPRHKCKGALFIYRPILRIRNTCNWILGPSAMLYAIRMCLWPEMDNGNDTTRPLVSLGFASGTNFISGIIPLLLLLLSTLWSVRGYETNQCNLLDYINDHFIKQYSFRNTYWIKSY